MCQHGQERDAFPPPLPINSEAGGRAGLESEEQESCSCLPPAIARGRAGSAPRVRSTIEPICWQRCVCAIPEVVSMGKLSPLRICYMAAQAGRAGPEITRVGELPRPLPPPAATLRRAGPAPRVGSTVESTPLVEVWVG